MKCNNCQTEWNNNGDFTDIKKCPFCGKTLNNEKIIIDDNSSFGSVLKEIEKRCGKEIWKDRTKAVSVFKDLAPGMEKERILLMLALESHIHDIFEREKDSAVGKAQIQLLDCFGERPIEDILLAFSDLHNIEVDRKIFARVTGSHNIQDNGYKSSVESKNNQSGYSLSDLKVGDILDFGSFNGGKIKWKVLEKDKSSVYVISKEILCNRAFNSNYSNNWSESGLRKWLNTDFYSRSFSTDEKNKIKTENSDNVTLLSKEESERLMAGWERGLHFWWWLRTPYFGDDYSVWSVNDVGEFNYDYAVRTNGVRPTLHIYY